VKLGFIATILLCLFPSLTSFLTAPLARFHAAAASGTLTGNRIIDRGVDGLPVKAAIEDINKFPAWAKTEAQALPSQVAPVDSWVQGRSRMLTPHHAFPPGQTVRLIGCMRVTPP
jgi:hypothetical protein